MNNLENFLENVNLINSTIRMLLNEEGGVIHIPGTKTVKEKYIVVDDNTNPKDDEIKLKDAIKYKVDAKVGDEIEIPVIDFEGMDEDDIQEKLKEMLEDGKISWTDIQDLAVAGSSRKVRRTAWGVIKAGPKIVIVAGKLMLLRKLKKEIPHSECYCVKLFENNKDETVTPQVPDRVVYEEHLSKYIDTVRDEFLKGWDECADKYGELISDEDKRKKSLNVCPSIEDFATNARQVLNDILNSLRKFYNIKGIDVEKKTLGGANLGVAESIGRHDKLKISFTTPTPKPAGGPTGNWTGDKIFTIYTYKQEGNTVKLSENGTDFYLFEFQKSEPKKQQQGKVQWYDNTTQTPSTVNTTWKGYIIGYVN